MGITNIPKKSTWENNRVKVVALITDNKRKKAMCKLKNIIGLITILTTFLLSGKMWGMNSEKAQQKAITILGFMKNDICLLTKLTVATRKNKFSTFYDLPTKPEYKQQLGKSKLKQIKSDNSVCYLCPDKIDEIFKTKFIKTNGNTFSWVSLGNYTNNGFRDAEPEPKYTPGPARKLLQESKELEQAFKKLGVLNVAKPIFIVRRRCEKGEIKYRIILKEIKKDGGPALAIPESNESKLQDWLQQQEYVNLSDKYILRNASADIILPEGYYWGTCKNISTHLTNTPYPTWFPKKKLDDNQIISNLEKLFDKAQIDMPIKKIEQNKDINNKVANKKEELLLILGRWWEGVLKYRVILQETKKNGKKFLVIPEKNDINLQIWLQQQKYVEFSDNYLLHKASLFNIPNGYCWDSCKNISDYLDKQLYPAWVPEDYAINPTTQIMSNLEKLFDRANVTKPENN